MSVATLRPYSRLALRGAFALLHAFKNSTYTCNIPRTLSLNMELSLLSV